jgi:RNA-directed DNA polymerase
VSKDSVRELQRKLYRAAKADGDRRFHSLRDKLYRVDVLERAWQLVKANQGTYGVDRCSIAQIEAAGVETFLEGVARELREGIYRAKPARRVNIPKPGKPGCSRPLSIPTVTSYSGVAQRAFGFVGGHASVSPSAW